MSRFVTVDRQSADYKRYLSGSFSSTEMALPVPVLEGAQLSANQTFQIFNDGEIARPSFFKIFLKLLRLDLIAFTLVPAIVIWLLTDERVTDSEEWVLLASLICLHGATFSFNDYFDHMQGRDHVNEKSGSRLIQNGFIRAHEVLRIAWILWSIAFAGGLFLAYHNPMILVFAAIGASLGMIGSMYQFLGLKSIGFSDIALLLALGPILTLGIQFTLTKDLSFAIFFIGSIYGLLALVYSQGKNLSSSMLDHQAGIRTISVRLGFDKAKTFLMFELASTVLISLYIFKAHFLMVPFYGLAVGYGIWRLNKVKSPLSGAAQSFPGYVLVLHNIFSLCCIINQLLIWNGY